MAVSLADRTAIIEELKRYYHEEQSRIVRRGMKHAVESGQAVNQLPLGYKKVNGITELDTETARQIAKAFKLLALPSTSLRSVLAELQKAGLTAKRGKPLSLSTLQRIASNPFYAGLIRYNGEVYPGNHQAIISLRLFQQVQVKLRQNKNGTPHA